MLVVNLKAPRENEGGKLWSIKGIMRAVDVKFTIL